MKTLLTVILLCILSIQLNAQWTNGQNADYVIGQADFSTSSSGRSAITLNLPGGLAVDAVNRKLYVSDAGNNRILRFSLPINQNQPIAELVFGQADFVSGMNNRASVNCTANTLYGPRALAVYNGTLWAVDASNYRVLRFDNAFSLTTNGPDANAVLGQKILTTNTAPSGTNDSSFSYSIEGICIDAAGNLFVSEREANRVLRFNNAAAKVNGAKADGVLGQPGFTTNAGAQTATGMTTPVALAAYGMSIFVSANQNYRVARFDNAASKANGAAADSVLGQPNFTALNIGTTQNRLPAPWGIAFDKEGTLYAVCSAIPRVSIFTNALSKTNGANADFVLGQTIWSTTTRSCTQSTFVSNVHAVAYDTVGNQLFVDDYANNRIMVFTKSGSTGVSRQDGQPQSFALSQNYPNPFNPATVMSYELPVPSSARLVVYDLLGREVAMLVNEKKPAGRYSVTWDASKMASGVYFYSLRAGEFRETKRMIFIK
jgi:DNA-binding beta-propeller fold protein YncE